MSSVTNEWADKIGKSMGLDSSQPRKEPPKPRRRKPQTSYSRTPSEDEVDVSLEALIDMAVHVAKRDYNSPNEASANLLATIYLRRAHDRLHERNVR